MSTTDASVVIGLKFIVGSHPTTLNTNHPPTLHFRQPLTSIHPSSLLFSLFFFFPAFQPSLFIHLSHLPTLNTTFSSLSHTALPCGYFYFLAFLGCLGGFHWCLYSFFSDFRGVGPNALGWQMNCHTSRIHQSLSSTPSGVVDLICGMFLVQRIGRVVDW